MVTGSSKVWVGINDMPVTLYPPEITDSSIIKISRSGETVYNNGEALPFTLEDQLNCGLLYKVDDRYTPSKSLMVVTLNYKISGTIYHTYSGAMGGGTDYLNISVPGFSGKIVASESKPTLACHITRVRVLHSIYQVLLLMLEFLHHCLIAHLHITRKPILFLTKLHLLYCIVHLT